MKNFIYIVLSLLGVNAFAQQANISGHLVSNDGKGVPMATVQLLEIAKGTQADENGKFNLKNIAP